MFNKIIMDSSILGLIVEDYKLLALDISYCIFFFCEMISAIIKKNEQTKFIFC